MLVDERKKNDHFKVLDRQHLDLKLDEIKARESTEQSATEKRHGTTTGSIIEPSTLNKFYTRLSANSHDEAEDEPKSKPIKGGSDVFRRLTNPQHFTGIQKQLMETRLLKKKTQSKKEPRKKPPVSPSSASLARNGGSSVFERLQSPLNYTGTQKRVHTSSSQEVHEDKISQISPSSAGSNRNKRPSVFERLQSPLNYTGIQKRVHTSSSHEVHEDKISQISPSSVGSIRSKGPSVFERLQSPLSYTGMQKRAHLMEEHDVKEPVLHSRSDFDSDSPLSSPENLKKSGKVLKSSSRDWVSNYADRNVFKRLHGKTTSAFESSKFRKDRDSSVH